MQPGPASEQRACRCEARAELESDKNRLVDDSDDYYRTSDDSLRDAAYCESIVLGGFMTTHQAWPVVIRPLRPMDCRREGKITERLLVSKTYWAVVVCLSSTNYLTAQ